MSHGVVWQRAGAGAWGPIVDWLAERLEARLLTDTEGADRGVYPRLLAPAYFSPVGLPLFQRKGRATDGGLGGVSVYSDDEVKQGSRLKLEVFLPDGTSVVCEVQVGWVKHLPDGAPARCDLGLKFTAIQPQDRERLSPVLSQA